MNEHVEEGAKGAPAGSPFVPSELGARIRRAADEGADEWVRVRLEIEGGQHEERYRFRFATLGRREIESEIHDGLRSMHVEPTRKELAASDVTALLRAIDVEGLLAASRARPSIPPDSLVGRLTVGDGEQEVSVVFMADEQQARTAGYEPPPAVARLVERIYELGAETLGAKDLRP